MYGEFRDGCIISLQLHNFQTYSDIKFDFHPKLNFIAGPNGSGKSTVANAIAFIFGGGTKVLNKSKDLMDFIKFDTDNSYIEVKIKHRSKVLTVRRVLVPLKNSSLWLLNGSSTAYTKIQQIYAELRININNICNYLPQEKVAEFTRFSPEELFRTFVETYHEQDMVEKINTLIDMESSYDGLSGDLEKILCNKRAVEKVISSMSRDIEKAREREEAQKRIELINSKKKWLIYESEKKEYLTLKTNSVKIDNEIGEMQREIEECDKRIRSSTDSREAREHERKLAEIRESNAALERFVRNIEDYMHDKDKIGVDVKSNEKKRESALEKTDALEVERLNNIEKLENFKLPDRPPMSVNKDFDRVEQEMIGLKQELAELHRQGCTIASEVEELTKRKNLIVDIELRRLEILKHYHRDTYAAVVWLRSNKDKFCDEIIEPCILSLSLKNTKFMNEIEGFLSYQALTSFICKDFRDFELLMKTLKDKMKLAINAVECNFKAEKAPYTGEQIRALGFDGYLIDYVDDRKEVLDFLSSMLNFTSIPVTKNDLDEVAVFKKYNFAKMAVNNRYLAIKKNRYDHRDFTIIENKLPKLNLFNKFTSHDELATLERKLKEIEGMRASNQSMYKEKLEKVEKIKSYFEKIQATRDEEKMKMYEYERKMGHRERLVNEIKSQEIQLERSRDLSVFDAQQKHLNSVIEGIEVKIRTDFERLKSFVTETEKDFFRMVMETARMQQRWHSLMAEIRDLEIKREVKKHKIDELGTKKAFFDRERENRKKRINQIKTELVKYTTEEMSYVTELPEDIEQLEKRMASELAKITFLNADKKVLKDYKEKEKLLNDFHLKELEIENTRKASDQHISNLKEELIGSLNAKVAIVNSNFSAFFQKLNFEGKVELETENTKASRWKLSILARFRKEEPMQQLCSYIQSGGERSVSTIIFLLSLLEATPAPFRLVDEINQGMDAYNERMVHSILINLIKSEDSPQFFIITPKLVNDLDFNDSMRIFVIYAGTFGRMRNKFDEYKTTLLQ